METKTVDSPIFIISNPRSGSTLLRSILSSQSLISIPHEFPVFQKLYSTQDRNHKSWEAKVSKLYEFQHFKEWNIPKKDLLTKLGKIDSPTVKIVVNLIYSYFLNPNISGKYIWGEKNIGNIGYLKEIESIFPDARFIIINRDPRDVVASILKRKWMFSKYKNCPRRYMKSIIGITQLYKDGYSLINKHVSLNKFVISYEDLVKSPNEVVEEICDFLKVPFEAKMLQYNEISQNESLKISEKRIQANHENILKPININLSSKFQSELSSNQIETIEYLLKNEMNELGYEPINPNPKPNSIFLHMMKMHNSISGELMFSAYKLKKIIFD